MKIQLKFSQLFFLIVVLTVSNFCQSRSADNLNAIKLLMIDGKYPEAIKNLKSIIENDSSNVEALYYLGLNYESMSRYVDASNVLQKAVKYKANDTKLLLSLGTNYFSAGLINDAETVLSKAFLLDSTNSQIQIILGRVFMNGKKWDKAASLYSKLIKCDSANSYFYEQTAKCEEQLGNINEAIANYKTANSLNPRNMNTTLELSYLLYLQNQFKEATQVVDSGLNYYPNSISLWERKGDINIKIQDYNSALASYYRALQLEILLPIT